MNISKRVLTFAKFFVAILLVTFLLGQVNWNLFKQTLSGINFYFIFLYVILQMGALVFSVRKWQVVAKARSIHFPFMAGFQQYLLGVFINNFLPSTVGGDVYRSRWLEKYANISFGKAFYTVAFERLQGVWLIFVIALFFPVFYPSLLRESLAIKWFVILAFLAFLSSVIFFTMLRAKKTDWLLRYVPRRLQELYQNLETDFQHSPWRKGLLETFLFILIGPVLSNFVLFWSVGTILPFGSFFFLAAMATILVSIPLSLGNIGVKEGAYIILFSVLGVTLEAVLAVSLISRAVQLMISLAALPLYLRTQKK